MSRAERLKEWQASDSPVVVWACGHGCELNRDSVRILGYGFDIGWSRCHNTLNHPRLSDLITEFFIREIGVRLVLDREAQRMAIVRVDVLPIFPVAINGHYSRRLVCPRDIARMVPKRKREKCQCGKVALYSVNFHRMGGCDNPGGGVFRETLQTPYFRRLSNGEWIPEEPRKPWYLRGTGWDWYIAEMDRKFCSASCWLRSRLEWRKEKAAKLRKQREMKWIRRAHNQLKQVRRFLSQPMSHEALGSR